MHAPPKRTEPPSFATNGKGTIGRQWCLSRFRGFLFVFLRLKNVTTPTVALHSHTRVSGQISFSELLSHTQKLVDLFGKPTHIESWFTSPKPNNIWHKLRLVTRFMPIPGNYSGLSKLYFIYYSKEGGGGRDLGIIFSVGLPISEQYNGSVLNSTLM